MASLREERTVRRHASDGGGTAQLLEGAGGQLRARAGEPGRFRIGFETGPEGIAVGGRIFFQVSPFWGWSTPQVEVREAAGFTTVETEAAGVELVPTTVDRQLLAVDVAGRALAPGERIEFTYGAGPSGAMADRFAEAGSPIFLAVDGDGDGLHGFLAEPVRIPVDPGPPARLVALLPSVARPGVPVLLRLSVLDAAGNAGVRVKGDVELTLPEGVGGPERLAIVPDAEGRVQAELVIAEPGVVRVSARFGGLEAQTNPLWVSAEAPRVRWADLHGHSVHSDGTGTPDDFYRYARDVAALDVAALTDHDHWGIPFLDEMPEVWEEIQDTAARFHDPGRFVVLVGYEWTSWMYGHRHVLHFENRAELLSSIDEATDTPAELWKALRGKPALTFAHHSAGDPIATDWSFAPDPLLEPVTEVASVHGNSESPDAPTPLRGGIPGNWVPDALAKGYKLGFVGSGDSHDGHPGLAHLASGTGGLAAIVTEDLTRAAVRQALLDRHCYATNGPRIVLAVDLDGEPAGRTLPAGEAGRLSIRAHGTAPIDRVTLVSGGHPVASVPGEGRLDVAFGGDVGPFEPGEHVYVRVVQEDGGAAWSSPFFFE